MHRGNQTIMMLVVLAAALAAARADCDACVEGRCYTRKTLARGLHIPDQMAIDRKKGILYVHTDSQMDTAILHDDLTIQLVRRLNFTGLAVDQDTQVLYTADSQNIHKYVQNSINNTIEVTLSNQNKYVQPDLLFYKDCLTYTEKSKNGLHTIINAELRYYLDMVNYTISDFAVQIGCDAAKIYFVANDTVYAYNGLVSPRTTEVVAKKKYVLSTDKYSDVYFGDETLNVIYKMNNETNKLVEYASYASETGSVDKFVFDNNNNIVSYDSSDGSFSYWKFDATENADCTITQGPYSKYHIIKGVRGQY